LRDQLPCITGAILDDVSPECGGALSLQDARSRVGQMLHDAKESAAGIVRMAEEQAAKLVKEAQGNLDYACRVRNAAAEAVRDIAGVQ
jgi:hypothetical protein